MYKDRRWEKIVLMLPTFLFIFLVLREVLQNMFGFARNLRILQAILNIENRRKILDKYIFFMS
jgi:hypothetical protein